MSYHNMAHYYPQAPAATQLSIQNTSMSVKQQPEDALVVKDHKTRKPLDPPPVIEICVNDDPHNQYLHSPYLFVVASLRKPDDDELVEEAETSLLMGQLCSSLHRLKGPDNEKEVGYFVFGDISIKMTGRFRLRFSLFEFKPSPYGPEHSYYQFLARCDTQVFTVVSQKEFKGMRPSTYLSRLFVDQGVKFRLRKEQKGANATALGKRQRELDASSPPREQTSPNKRPMIMSEARPQPMPEERPLNTYAPAVYPPGYSGFMPRPSYHQTAQVTQMPQLPTRYSLQQPSTPIAPQQSTSYLLQQQQPSTPIAPQQSTSYLLQQQQQQSTPMSSYSDYDFNPYNGYNIDPNMGSE